NSCTFANDVYDPKSYIPALALCYQLDTGSDDATAMKCASAAKSMALDLLSKYESGGKDCDGTTYTFGRDTGYDIRFNLMYLMIALDWLHDQFASDERARLVTLANNWINWYHTTPGYAESHPYENYFAGYMQGILTVIMATAGENANLKPIVDLMNEKLYWE